MMTAAEKNGVPATMHIQANWPLYQLNSHIEDSALRTRPPAPDPMASKSHKMFLGLLLLA
jgi:hypothetical protein